MEHFFNEPENEFELLELLNRNRLVDVNYPIVSFVDLFDSM